MLALSRRQTLISPSGHANRAPKNPARRPTMLALSRRQTLISPSGHANRAPRIPPGGRPCWRCPAGKRLYHRRATPTGRPKSRPAADHVGAVPPANAYITVGPRQQGAPNPARRLTMLALSRRQTLISPSGHANRAPRIPPGGRPCWRCPAGKRLYHRRATPTGRPKSRPAADHVGAVPPANAISPSGRQQGAQNPARRRRPCWRCPAGKRLYHRRATPTGRPKSRPAADHVGAVPPANAYITVGPRQQGAQAMMKKKKTADTYPS